MDLKLYEDYLYTRKLDLDLSQQRENAHKVHDWIMKKYEGYPSTHPGGSHVTKYYAYYNYLAMTLDGMPTLFNVIKETFNSCNNHAWGGNPPDKEYVIQCWLNYYSKGEFIDWHGHLSAEARAWHGFYCLDVEPNSSTTYRLDGKEVEIKSEDNLLVIGKSINDKHRSSEWNEDKPRITIAFDVSPVSSLNSCFTGENEKGKTHYWIPL